jgi:hypothetical protein
MKNFPGFVAKIPEALEEAVCGALGTKAFSRSILSFPEQTR